MAHDTVLVATTSQAGLHPIGTGGQPVTQAFDQIDRYLRQNLSEDHARLFAEPNLNPARGTVDWYAEADGDLQRYDLLAPEAQAELGSRVAKLRDDIQRLAERLSRSGRGGDRVMGHMLTLALEIPGEEYVYSVGGRPLLVCWGTLRDEPQPERGVLQRFIPYAPAAAAVAAAPAAAAVPQEPAPAPAAAATVVAIERPLFWLAWLLWLLFGLLVATIFVVLLSGCGVTFPGSAWLRDNAILNLCPGPAAADPGLNRTLTAEQVRTGVLEDELRRLELALAMERRACAMAPAVTPVPVQPAPTAPAAVPEETPPVGTPADTVPADEPEALAPEDDASLPDQDTGEPEAPAAEPPPEEDAQENEDPPPSEEDTGDFDERLEREGGERGEITVTLTWNSNADLDLFVSCPNGERIYHASRTACGGSLDVDMNVANRMSEAPIENVVWPEGAAAPGTYIVSVNNFNSRSDGLEPTPFQIRVINGEEVQVIEGSIGRRDGTQVVHEFYVE